MPFDSNQLPEWNAPGVEPPQSKKDEGWGVTEKPPADWFNWFFYRTYNALKSLFNLAQHKEEKGQPNGYASLDGNGKIPETQIKDATVSQKGIVQLNNTVSSTSTTQVATANAVKTAYDRAVNAENNAKAASAPIDHVGAGGNAHAVATTSQAGFMSASDKTKLDGITAGAEVNQNTFSNVKVGTSTIAADSKTDTLELVAGSNITLTADTINDRVTIAANVPVTSVNSKTGAVTLSASDVGAETPSGAQAKADQAEINAKNASLPRTGGKLTGDLEINGWKTKNINGSTGTSVQWIKVARIQNTSAIDGNEYATFTGVLVVQRDYGNTANETIGEVNFSFGVRGEIKPVLFVTGDAAKLSTIQGFKFRVYRDASGWHYLYFMRPKHSRFASFLYRSDGCTEYWTQEDPTTISGLTLVWDSDNGSVQDVYVGKNKVWHEGNGGAGSGLDADTVDGKHFSDIQADAQVKADQAEANAKAASAPIDHVGAGGNAHAVATQSQAGFMSASDKTKLDGIASGAEVNQNAFSNVKVGTTTIGANSKTDTLELAAGSNITLTVDSANDRVTIAANVPVTSVNNKTGAVVLSASDVGAETPSGAQAKANQAETNAKNAAHLKTANNMLSVPSQSQVIASKSATQTVSHGIYTKVTLDVEHADTQGEFSNSAFIPKESGTYLIITHTVLQSAPTGDVYHDIWENGVQLTHNGVGYNQKIGINTRLLQLVAGRTYEFYIQVWNSNNAATISAAQLFIYRLG